MNKITITLILLCCGIFLAVGTATAAMTDILPGPETRLTGPRNNDTGDDSILNQLYGWDNLTRVDDYDSGVLPNDQIWFNPDEGEAQAQAMFAGFSQNFGYIPQSNDGTYNSSDFVPLFDVAGFTNAIGLGGPSAPLDWGNVPFLWALDPSGEQLWTSQSSPGSGQNGDEFDHMVTWLIEGNEDRPNNTVGNYVIAWEDLRNGGDQDFNDLVVEVTATPIPIPAAILLLGSGLVGLAGIRKKFKR
jgi:hypothetical protein